MVLIKQYNMHSKKNARLSIWQDEEVNLDLRELEKSIRAVKGVGEKRTEEIMLIIEKWLGVE